MHSMEILKVTHIKKAFGDNEVLKDVNFSLERGKVYVLMGTNGSGKTTLFNIITGFLKADAGEVKLRDRNITNQEPHIINQMGIGRTFQDLRLIEGLSVIENVMLAFPGQEGEKWWKVLFPNKRVRNEQAKNKQKAEEILKTCFIDDVARARAGEISYGQQKLLTLACCIANNAELFLLDEVVAGVNPRYRELLVTIIREWQQDGKTFLIIEHNSDFIKAVSDQILFLNEGRVRKYTSYDQLRDDAYVQEAFV